MFRNPYWITAIIYVKKFSCLLLKSSRKECYNTLGLLQCELFFKFMTWFEGYLGVALKWFIAL